MKKLHVALSAAALISSGLMGASVAHARSTGTLSDQEAVRRSYSLLQAKAADFGIESATSELRVRQVIRDSLQQTHVRLDQYYKGLPVFGEQLITHFDARGRLLNVNGTFKPVYDLSVRPAISSSRALDIALFDFGQTPSEETRASLVVLHTNEGDTMLAWHVKLEDIESDAPSSWTYFINAQNGRIVWDFDSLETAPATGLGHSLYLGDVELGTSDGPTFSMTDSTRGGMNTTDMKNGTSGNGITFTDDDNEWGNGRSTDRASAAVDAHYGVAQTWDFYKEKYGRNGINNDNKGALSRVHYSVNYVNAFWSDSCFCMTYGDGDGSTASALVSVDVAAHEMTHGVTAATAGLVYNGESGGLNESMSDIMGAMVEFYIVEKGAQTTPEYWIGEDIWTPSKPGDALRYMDQPTKDGRSIDNASKMKRGLDVHYSSGVQNNVFFLASEGGTNKTSGKKVAVGIGHDKVGAIFYRALVTYYTPRSNFVDARKATLKAATDLYGQAEADVMGQAWTACGVN